MRITNNYYDEVIYRYSKTAEALRKESTAKFDAVLVNAQSRPLHKSGQDALLMSVAQRFSRTESGRDTLLSHSRRTQTTGYDALLYDAAKKYGAATCV
jgi:hypothetical protein